MSDKSYKDRRTFTRVALDTPYFVRISVIGGDSYKVILSNISARGIQAELPVSVGSGEVPGNARVEISEFPDDLKYLNQISGTVMWVTDGHCGIQFEQELEDDNFVDFLEHL